MMSKQDEGSRLDARWPPTFGLTLSYASSRAVTFATCRCREGAQKEPRRLGGRWHGVIAVALLLSVAACAGPEPLLRSNKHLQLYGKQMGQQDTEACQRKAEEAGLEPGVHRSGNAAAGAALGLVVGGAVGASAGLIGGVPGVTIGAAAGGGLGLILGLVGGAYKPLVPEAPYADSVVRCLIEKGYEVSGWD